MSTIDNYITVRIRLVYRGIHGCSEWSFQTNSGRREKWVYNSP